MATFDDVRRHAGTETGLAVVALTRADGSVHASVVNAGPITHPVDGTECVAFVVRGDSVKRARVRQGGRVSVTFRRGWRWVGVEGPAELIGPDDPREGVDVPTILRDVYKAAGGSHEDWDEYDRVMADERRTAVFVTPERIIGQA